MKLQRIIWSALVLFLSINLTYANSSDAKMIISVKKQDDLTIKLRLANLNKQRTGIKILDINGKAWFSEYAWNDDGYAKQLNLEEMPDGTYFLVIKNKNTNHTQAFVIRDQQLILFRTESSSDLVHLTSNKEKNDAVTISTFDKRAMDCNIINSKQTVTDVSLNHLSVGILSK
ncbi:MAG: T9SS type A sorting domain-containing protein, partial [Bacteroidota bacterium]